MIGRDRLGARSERRFIRRELEYPRDARRATLSWHIGLNIQHAGARLRAPIGRGETSFFLNHADDCLDDHSLRSTPLFVPSVRDWEPHGQLVNQQQEGAMSHDTMPTPAQLEQLELILGGSARAARTDPWRPCVLSNA